MKIQFVWQDGQINFQLGSNDISEATNMAHQFFDPILSPMGYRIKIEKIPESQRPNAATEKQTKFKRL